MAPLSVRTVTYRLDRIKALTGYDMTYRPTGSQCRRRLSAPRS